MSLVDAFLALPVVATAAEAVVLGLLSVTVVAGVSFLYRLRARADLPDSVALLLGLGAATLGLGTRHAFVQLVGGGAQVLTLGVALGNVLVLAVAGVAAVAGNQLGIRLAASAWAQGRSWRFDVGPLVRATGRFTSVTLPEEVGDVDGYDPVAREVKEEIAGARLDFPRGLTVDALEEQIALRLRDRHDVGYVDVEVDADGDVRYLAVGHRSARLGPTLPPGSAAVAVEADPPFGATAGDVVQIWRPGSEPERVGLGEVRAAVGSVATLAVDEAVAEAVDPRRRHRLVTLPGTANAERDFAAALRRADETLGVLILEADDPLVGGTVGDVDLTVVAVEGEDRELETIPSRDRVLAAGETVFVLGRPEAIRRLSPEAGSTPAEVPGVLAEARDAVDPVPEGVDEARRPDA